MWYVKSPSQRGFALLSVLWVTAFLAVIAASLSFQSRTNVQLVKNNLEYFKVQQQNKGMILSSVIELLGVQDVANQAALERFHSVSNNTRTTILRLQDEAGKIDINIASAEMFMSLLVQVGLDHAEATNITNAMLDWRDNDSLKRINGAEAKQYQQAGYPYIPTNKDYDRIEELQLIFGMTPNIYRKIEPFVTVYSLDLGVNISEASPLVKLAVQQAPEFRSIFSEENELEIDLGEYVTNTGGYIFTVSVSSILSSGVNAKTSAIVRLDKGNFYQPFTVLKWKDY